MTRTADCRVCGSALGTPALSLGPPAITSLATVLPLGTEVSICSHCGHIQSPPLPDLARFYDTGYGISLSSEDHDQLMEVRDGTPIFRTDRQAEVVLALAAPGGGARVLDYGAAKATTLRKIIGRRPDILPHVFDVSEDYRPSWDAWLDPAAAATYEPPAAWRESFDLVTAHFVLEHAAEPLAMLRELRGLLKPEGRLLFSVPDWARNKGDLLVVDHMNHFTEPSIAFALAATSFELMTIDRVSLPAAFAVLARPVETVSALPRDIMSELVAARATCAAWAGMSEGLAARSADHTDRPSAIYGAGVYGSFIRLRLADGVPLRCFVDNNRHLWGSEHLGVAVKPLADLPDDVRVVYIGLNPARARQIVSSTPELARPGLDLVFLDQ